MKWRQKKQPLGIFFQLLNDVCRDVEIVPNLQFLQGGTFTLKMTTNDDDARFDIKANGLWESKVNKT